MRTFLVSNWNLFWTPFENLIVDAAYSYLDSSIKAGSTSVDPVGRTVGDTSDTKDQWLILTDLAGAAYWGKLHRQAHPFQHAWLP